MLIEGEPRGELNAFAGTKFLVLSPQLEHKCFIFAVSCFMLNAYVSLRPARRYTL